VLTGRNGTGKTSVLEAIQLAHDLTALNGYYPAVGRLINVEASTTSVDVERSDDTFHFSLERVDPDTAFPLVSKAAVSGGVVYKETKKEQHFSGTLKSASRQLPTLNSIFEIQVLIRPILLLKLRQEVLPENLFPKVTVFGNHFRSLLTRLVPLLMRKVSSWAILLIKVDSSMRLQTLHRYV
jgi:hypothetical protein